MNNPLRCTRLIALTVAALVAAAAAPALAEPELRLGWRLRVADHPLLAYGPTELGGLALAAEGDILLAATAGGELLAVATSTGEVLYSVPMGGGGSVPPLVAGESLFTGSDNGTINRFRLSNGRSQWAAPVRLKGAIRGSMVLWRDELLLLQDDQSIIYAVDARRGELLAQFDRHSYSRRGLSPFTVFAYPELTLSGNRLYAGFETGYIARFDLDLNDPRNGFKPTWERGPCAAGELTTGKSSLCSSRRVFRDLDSAPTPRDGRLVAGCFCRGLLLLDEETGEVRSELPVLGPSSPLLLGDLAIVSGADGTVRAVELTGFANRWVTKATVEHSRRPVPIGSGDQATVMVTTGKALLLLAAGDGRLLLRLEGPGGIASPPVVAGEAIFLLSNEGYLYRYDYFR